MSFFQKKIEIENKS